MKLLESAGKVAHVVIADLFHRAAYRDIRVFQQPHGGVDFDFCDLLCLELHPNSAKSFFCKL